MRRNGQLTSLAIATIAMAIALIAVTEQPAVTEAKRVANYTGDIFGQQRISFNRTTPAWLNRILPVAPLPLIDKVSTINYISPLTNDDSVRIASQYKVRKLWLSGGQVTDVGVNYLRDHSTITELSLRNTQVTDDAAPVLATISSLEVLSLYGTNVSDVSVPELASLPRLRKLNLTETRVSPEAIERLQAKLPNCRIEDF